MRLTKWVELSADELRRLAHREAEICFAVAANRPPTIVGPLFEAWETAVDALRDACSALDELSALAREDLQATATGANPAGQPEAIRQHDQTTPGG